MSKRAKNLRYVAIGIAALLMILIVVAAVVVQTTGFRSFLERKIIAAAEESSGGKVEIGGLEIDWRHLVATNLTIHGREPAGSQPFFQVGLTGGKLR